MADRISTHAKQHSHELARRYNDDAPAVADSQAGSAWATSAIGAVIEPPLAGSLRHGRRLSFSCSTASEDLDPMSVNPEGE